MIKFYIIFNFYIKKENNKIFSEYSKISLKIKGEGENSILGNNLEYNFRGIIYLNQVFINGDKQNTTYYKYFFNKSDNLVELIWDDNIKSFYYMFYECKNITEINLSNFDASQITNMGRIFSFCSSSTSIDLSNFNTSKVQYMNGMFSGCSSLTSLDLSNFDTSQVENISGMFSSCLSLTSIDLSNFNTSKVQYMNGMFSGCSSLTSLDLSNFYISQVREMEAMFINCKNLEYINLMNFNTRQTISFSDMFSNIQKNAVICINKNITNQNLFQSIKNIRCHVIDCSNDWKLKQKKIIYNKNIYECVESCDNNTQYKYEYNGNCLENCPNGFLYENNSNVINKCKCELDKCLLCPQVALNYNLCTQCNVNYYPKENDPLNMGEYINCYNETEEGYYLDNNLFKKCYYTCKTCNIGGNNEIHNCLNCHNYYSFKIEKNNYFNCYENCSYYYYFDNENNYHCTLNLSCPEEYPKLIDHKNECIKYNIKDILKHLIIDNERNGTKKSNEEEIKFYDNILKKIEDEFTSDDYDTSNIDNGQDEIIKTEKITTTLTTSENQRNNKNNNMTKIDLGECEAI